MSDSTDPKGPGAWPDYRALVDHVPAFIWSALPDGKVDYVNPFALEFLGRTFDDVKNWDWASIVHPDDLPTVGEKWSLALETGEPYEIVMRFKRGRDGAYVSYRGRSVAMRDAQGRVVRWIGTHVDLDASAHP